MFRQKDVLTAFTLLCAAMLVIAAASPPAGSAVAPRAAPLNGAQAARTALPDLAATATALKATASAGATRIAATATALKATATALKATATALRATVTPPATVPAAEASAAIQAYASDVLGITVTVKKAGGLTGTVTRSLTQTPKGSAAQSATAKIAGQTYGATLANGLASLSYGTGAVSGDVTVDVQGASLGVYSLVVTGPTPLDADKALELAKSTFPNLSGLHYTAYSVSKGFAWYAKGSASGFDPKTKKVVTLAEAVILYVVPGSNGKASVSATVGRGEFASAIKAP